MSNLKISIFTEFLGKGLKDAQKGVKGFEKSIKNLSYLFGGGYLGAKVLAFSKQTVTAFAADDKAAQVLTRSLGNLGLAFENLRVKEFISDLEKQTGVLDDQLRPAFQRLLTTQGSVSEAQKSLRTALDLSAASGVDVVTVAGDLAKAYTGQTKGLAKYGLGLSQAELKGMKYADVQERINKLFGGQAALVADTYAGKLAKVNVQFANFQEATGKALLDGLDNLSGQRGGGISWLQKRFDALSGSIASTVDNFSRFAGAIGLGISGKGSAAYQLLNQEQVGSRSRTPADKNAVVPSIAGELAKKAFEDRMKAIREEAALAKKITNEKRQQLALEKQKNALAKASNILNQANKIFDDKAIQLAAAAQGKLTEEEKVRVKLKQDILNLEEAIQNNNVEAAASYANAIVQDSQKLQALRGDMEGLNAINNPFNAWLETIRAMAAELARLANIPIVQTAAVGSTHIGGTGLADWGAAAYEAITNPYAGTYYGSTGRDPMPVFNATVVLDTGVVAGGVRDAFITSSGSGSFSQINRTESSF